MAVLPWLLDWPSRRGTVAVFLLVTTVSVATRVAFRGVTDEITDEITAENVAVDETARLRIQVSTAIAASPT